MGTKNLANYAAKYANGVATPFQMAGAPTSGAGGSFVRHAVIGSLLVDTTNGKHYIATAANGSSVTWTVTGSQT